MADDIKGNHGRGACCQIFPMEAGIIELSITLMLLKLTSGQRQPIIEVDVIQKSVSI